MTPLLEVDALTAGYGGVAVLRALTLNVGVGECVAIVGSNGVGKSTLIRALLGQLPRVSGTIRFGDRDVADLPVEDRARLGMALVPEGRRVFPGLTVLENLEVASGQGGARRRQSLDIVFDLFPVLTSRRGHRAWQLSGGQQQMLVIGRALMTEPKLILMDEPTLGLAPIVSRDVIKAIGKIARIGTGILVSEQNESRLGRLVTRVLKLEAGHLAPL